MRWRQLLSIVLVMALLAGTGGPALAAPVTSYQRERVGDLTYRFRITGRDYEVRVGGVKRTTYTVPGGKTSRTYLTEGLGDRPISLNEAAGVAVRAAHGAPAGSRGVQEQIFSIWNSTVAKGKFIAGAIRDVWRAYNTYDDGRYMTIEDRYEAWKKMGFYDRYNEKQIKFINQKVIPIVRAAKAVQGILGSVLVGAGYATLAASALAIAGITAPAWAVAGGIAVVVGGAAALTVVKNYQRHRAGQNMMATNRAANLTGAIAGGAFGGGMFLPSRDPGYPNNWWTLRNAREALAYARELGAQGRTGAAGTAARFGLRNLGRFLKGSLAGLLGGWLVGNATSSLIRAENLGTIPLPGQTVATVWVPGAVEQPSLGLIIDPDMWLREYKLKVRLVD